MIIPDVNLLLYAHIDAFPEHDAAARWWVGSLNGDVEVGLPMASIFGFLRLATHRRVFATPMAVGDAIARVEEWLARPNVQLVLPGRRHLPIAFDLLRSAGTAANLTTDVQLAALAIELDAQLCSNDADFGRFPALDWVNPLRP